jgi:N6-adenosine-specific RNA methylase IME4
MATQYSKDVVPLARAAPDYTGWEPAKVLVADPPWPFGDRLPGPGRGAGSHYDLLSIRDIVGYPRPPLAKDCFLFLWRVSSMVEEAYDVCRGWGFVPKSELIWRKKTKHGKRHMGMGHSVRLEHEIAIIATRGRPKVRSRGIRSIFDTDGEIDHEAPSWAGREFGLANTILFEAAVGRHSEKPDEFYDLVEELADGPYSELFSRRERNRSWRVSGNELVL